MFFDFAGDFWILDFSEEISPYQLLDGLGANLTLSESNIYDLLLECFDCSVDFNEFVLQLPPQLLAGHGPADNRHLLDGSVDLFSALLEVFECLKSLIFGHQARARWMLCFFFFDHSLHSLIFTLFVILLDISWDFAIVFMSNHFLRLFFLIMLLLLLDKRRVIKDHLHHVVFDNVAVTRVTIHFPLQLETLMRSRNLFFTSWQPRVPNLARSTFARMLSLLPLI